MEIEEQEIVALNEFCIACLIKTDNMKQLHYTDEEITKLSSVSNLEIEVNDTLPSFLCNTCEEKLHISYDFQQLCQKTHQIILACLSASNSVTLRVNNLYNPIQLENSSENHEIHTEQLENNSNSSVTFINNDVLENKVQVSYEGPETDLNNSNNSISFVNNDILGNKVQVSYEESETELPADDSENFVLLNETPIAASADCIEKIKLSEKLIKKYNIKIKNTISNDLFDNEESFMKPSEVDMRMKLNETRTLSQDSIEEVDKIMMHLDENSSNIEILSAQLENESDSSVTFINNDDLDNFGEKYIEMENSNNTELLNYKDKFVKPLEVDKRTKSNQTMRLTQFCPEEVEKLIKMTRMRFLKHVDCLFCRFTAKDSRALSAHMTRVHRKQKENWCQRCNKSFENLYNHKKNHHKDDLKCPLCGQRKESTGHFMEHLAGHSSERKHKCSCGKSFISDRHLKSHQKIHTSEKPFTCHVCNEGFMLSKSFNSHLKTHNKHWSSTPQNYCKICDKKVRSLERHLDKHHSNKQKDTKDAGHLCPFCGKQLTSAGKLTVHMRIHTGETRYKCSFCEKRMTTKIHCVMHERTHTGEKPHVCKFCDRKFAQSSVLNTHMKRHTGKTEPCPLCPKRFCRPSELRQHMRNHTGEKPFECATCGRAFKQKSHLVEHHKIHSNERPYKCEYCEKSFKQSGTLKSHINIHLGKKPYKCSQCSYACRQSYSLSQHMQQHDSDQPKSDRPHRCEICDRSFTTIAMFTSHYDSQHRTLDSS